MSLPAVQVAEKIAYREAGARDAPAVVLLHGIGSTSATWKEQFEPLAARFRVIAWSAPGYDRSEPLPAEKPSALEYARALARLLDALGVGDAHVVSSSWGTLTSLVYANAYPARVRSIVLAGPTAGSHGQPPAQLEKIASERIARVRSLGVKTMREQDAPRLVSPRASREALQAALGLPGEAPTLEGYCQAVRVLYATDTVELIRPLLQRVLIVSGVDDIITPPPAHARMLSAAARSANFAALEDCGHLPYLEKPQRFNELLMEFLDA
jgi:pimeloyl-ACP methyl ester carboxylesterase